MARSRATRMSTPGVAYPVQDTTAKRSMSSGAAGVSQARGECLLAQRQRLVDETSHPGSGAERADVLGSGVSDDVAALHSSISPDARAILLAAWWDEKNSSHADRWSSAGGNAVPMPVIAALTMGARRAHAGVDPQRRRPSTLAAMSLEGGMTAPQRASRSSRSSSTPRIRAPSPQASVRLAATSKAVSPARSFAR